jgi:hypothetical protein
MVDTDCVVLSNVLYNMFEVEGCNKSYSNTQ